MPSRSILHILILNSVYNPIFVEIIAKFTPKTGLNSVCLNQFFWAIICNYFNKYWIIYTIFSSVGNRPGPRWPTALSNLVYFKWLYLIKDNHPYYLKIKSYWTCRIGTDRDPTRPDSIEPRPGPIPNTNI